MKMEIKKFGWIIMMCAAIAIGNVMSSCSDDTNGENGGNGGNGNGNGSGNKKTGPRFYTGNDADIAAANNGNGSGAGGRRSITD